MEHIRQAVRPQESHDQVRVGTVVAQIKMA
jgi:hypothetical protein